MNNDIVELLRTVIKEELSPINDRLGRIEKDVAGLKQDVAVLKQDVAGLKQDVAGLKQDVAGLKQDVAEIKFEQQKMNDRLTILESRQQKIYSQTGKLLEFRNEAIARLDQLATKEDLDFFDNKMGLHDREIFKLKSKI